MSVVGRAAIVWQVLIVVTDRQHPRVSPRIPFRGGNHLLLVILPEKYLYIVFSSSPTNQPTPVIRIHGERVLCSR